jgi:NADH:ubiquinone oxidoreductase subunit H
MSLLAAWLVYATPHFVFHLAQVHACSPSDDVAQLGTLGFLVLLPLALLVLVGTHGEQRKGAGCT